MARISLEGSKAMIVYRTALYTVETGESQMLEGVEVYICKNNTTGVVEAEEQMLPRIIDYADQLEAKVLEMIETEGKDIYPTDTKVLPVTAPTVLQ